MQEGQLLMTQAERDRLVALKKAKKKLISQREAADELKVSVRPVQRLLGALQKEGDKAVVHGLRGRASNRRIEEKIERQAVKDVGGGVFGREARDRSEQGDGAAMDDPRQAVAGKKARVKEVHMRRPRRSRLGELAQWDTSEHNCLEGRGEPLYLIVMIDDATSRLWARVVRSDSTEENMRLLWSYLEKFGRPLAFYTDKASLFQTAEKRKRDEPGVEKDAVEMPPTRIARALQELGIAWTAAHSPQGGGIFGRRKIGW
jgi:hypothetical protein